MAGVKLDRILGHKASITGVKGLVDVVRAVVVIAISQIVDAPVNAKCDALLERDFIGGLFYFGGGVVIRLAGNCLIVTGCLASV